MNDAERIQRRRIWPGPIRLFHWLLVICVATAWWFGENYADFSFNALGYHKLLGYAIGGLVVFRLLWGLFGPPQTSLRALFPGPRTAFGYMRGMFRRQPSYWPGHNPIGALSVLALLISLAVQVITGLFAKEDEIWFEEGPLAGMVDERTQVWLNGIHHLNSKILLILVALHVAAVLFYLIWKRENLVKPMVTGWKDVRDDHDSA